MVMPAVWLELPVDGQVMADAPMPGGGTVDDWAWDEATSSLAWAAQVHGYRLIRVYRHREIRGHLTIFRVASRVAPR